MMGEFASIERVEIVLSEKGLGRFCEVFLLVIHGVSLFWLWKSALMITTEDGVVGVTVLGFFVGRQDVGLIMSEDLVVIRVGEFMKGQ